MNEATTQTRTAKSARSAGNRFRFGLAAAAVVVGIVYTLIAVHAIRVAEMTGDMAGKEFPYLVMAAAAAAFWLGAVLLVLFDKRLVYLLGAAVQVVVLIGYFAIASMRDPHYEGWGVTMKAVEVVMLAMLLYRAAKFSSPRAAC